MNVVVRCLTAVALAALCVANSSAQTQPLVRYVFSAGGDTITPGGLVRTEGAPPTGDPDIDRAYDAMGDFFDAYRSFWNRDSYDNAGAPLMATVHYGDYCSARHEGINLILGDSNPVYCRSPAQSFEIVIHELTNLLIASERALATVGEARSVSYAMADISAAFVKAWVDGGRNGTLAVTASTWQIPDVWIKDPATRFMNDPAADGFSLDYWTLVNGYDAPRSAGIMNLAFYLLSQGGTHPRGRSTIPVTGIGLEKAIRIFYKANVDLLPGNGTFSDAANATIAAAAALGYSAAEQESVANAWRAVGVPVGDEGVVTLTNGAPVGGLSDAIDGARYFKLVVPAGQQKLRFVTYFGSGNVDLYVRFGSRPTLNDFDCRSWNTGNDEDCMLTPVPGTYYVMLRAKGAYSGATVHALYQPPPGPGDPYLFSHIPVTNISGSMASQRFWRITVPAGQRLVVSITGGFGADLYVRRGTRPYITLYDCLGDWLGNGAETCTINNTAAGDYYIMLYGYTFPGYFGVTLRAWY